MAIEEVAIISFPSDPEGILVRPRSQGAGWLTTRSGLSRTDARQMLAKRWKNVSKPLVGLRDRILSGEPTALVKAGKVWKLQVVCTPPPGVDPNYAASYYIGPPATRSAVRASLKRRGIAPDPLLIEFLKAFDGLAGSPPGRAGNFVPHGGWKTVLSFNAWDRDDASDMDDWKKWGSGYVFYYARNGDQILLSPKGTLGWYISPEGRFQSCWRTFSSFLRFYTRFQDYFRTLDSYATSRAFEGTLRAPGRSSAADVDRGA